MDHLLAMGVIAGTMVVFLLIRKLVLWYWGINEMHENQRKQNQLLEEILRTLKDK